MARASFDAAASPAARHRRECGLFPVDDTDYPAKLGVREASLRNGNRVNKVLHGRTLATLAPWRDGKMSDATRDERLEHPRSVGAGRNLQMPSGEPSAWPRIRF